MTERRAGAEALCYRTFATACWYEMWRYRRRMRGRVPVLVYQMGKVGSCSVVQSIKKLRSQYRPFHIHYLTDAGLNQIEKGNRRQFAVRGRIARHYLDSLYARRLLQRQTGDLKIITLLRDPVARSISAFFHFMEYTFPEFEMERKLEELSTEALVEALMPYFWKRFQWDRHRPRDWFTQELQGVLGFDVLAHPYPRERDYAVLRQPGLEVLVIKLEHLTRCAEPALREFLGLPEVPLHNTNEATGRSYYAAYQAFQNAVKIPADLLDETYGSPYVRHFYSDAEIAGFRSRWLASP